MPNIKITSGQPVFTPFTLSIELTTLMEAQALLAALSLTQDDYIDLIDRGLLEGAAPYPYSELERTPETSRFRLLHGVTTPLFQKLEAHLLRLAGVYPAPPVPASSQSNADSPLHGVSADGVALPDLAPGDRVTVYFFTNPRFNPSNYICREGEGGRRYLENEDTEEMMSSTSLWGCPAHRALIQGVDVTSRAPTRGET